MVHAHEYPAPRVALAEGGDAGAGEGGEQVTAAAEEAAGGEGGGGTGGKGTGAEAEEEGGKEREHQAHQREFFSTCAQLMLTLTLTLP